MSMFSELLETMSVKRSELIGKTKGVVSVFFSTDGNAPDDESGVDVDEVSEPADWWQHYGFASRPPEGTESLVLRAGATVAAFASRVLAGADIFGQLSVGDVALYSLGKNMIRLNADGSISAVKLTKKDKHFIVTITKDDELMVVVPDGPWLNMSKDKGVTIHAGAQALTLSSDKSVQIVAPKLACVTGTTSLHAAAARPMTGPSALAAPNVFV